MRVCLRLERDFLPWRPVRKVEGRGGIRLLVCYLLACISYCWYRLGSGPRSTFLSTPNLALPRLSVFREQSRCLCFAAICQHPTDKTSQPDLNLPSRHRHQLSPNTKFILRLDYNEDENSGQFRSQVFRYPRHHCRLVKLNM